jgi:glycine/D-amino acid oxidase-like deaminating enzyme
MSAPRGAAVVVIGGGVVGASAAYHLAARGQRDVVIVDRGPGHGSGSTGRATGGFRAQYATAINVRLSLLAREKLRHFAEETGGEAGYMPVGYLWLARTSGELDVLRAGRALQHREGLTEAVEVTPDDIRRLNPAVQTDGILGGAFCPTDGFLRPMGLAKGYLSAAARLGVQVEWDTAVTGLDRDASGRIVRVQTASGPIAVDAVVNAAGAWAAGVAAMAGVDLPVTPLRRQVAATVPCDFLPADMPMTIWAGDGFHLRVRDGRVLLLWPTPGVPGQPFEAAVEPAWIAAISQMAAERVPVLAGVAVDHEASWAGLYEMSPDKHSILGASPTCENLWLINGSSGHGVMHAPALGHLLAELMLDGDASTLDVHCLRPSRFLEGEPNPVSELL